MGYFKNLVRDNRPFFIPFLLFQIVGICLVVLLDKYEIHLFLNDYHTPFLDKLFIGISELGGTAPLFVCAAVFFFRVRLGCYMSVLQLAANAITALVKPLFHIDRPKLLFEQLNLPLYTIDTLQIHAHNSFPSGHTTAAFALFFALCLAVKNKTLKLICFFLALLTGFSRIYLAQHFLEDVLAGSAVALFVGLLLYRWFDDSHSWGNRSVQYYVRQCSKKAGV
ncbi:MAG: phosphatase PAP2 family protein [Prevotellaceae bacterium]|jgi:membrane-associated phospholipid phosphatase|nr:phosphatase PAP2 family protein [Prevotellaceae bacterium]